MNSGHKTLESMSQAVWYNRWTLKQFEKFISGDILEVGCGIGTFTKSLSNYGIVTGIDIDSHNLKKAYQLKGVKVGLGDIEKGKYFFGKKKFNTVVCLNVLEHIFDDQRTLKNISLLLKPNGHLILLVPFHPLLFGEIDRSIGHYRRYRKDQLKSALKEARLKVKKMRIINFFGGVGWLIAGRLLKNKVVSSSKIDIFNIIAPLVLPWEELVEPPLGTSILLVAKK